MSRGIPVALIAVLLFVSLPNTPAVHADTSCGNWKPTIANNDDRIAIQPFSEFQGSGCEIAYQITDKAGSLSISLPFAHIQFSSQIAGYTLEMNVTGSDNAAVTKLGGSAIPGIDDELHLKPTDAGTKARVTLDGSVTAKSLSVDMLLVMINTIFDALGISSKCIPYSYVYGLIVDYIPTTVKAAGYLLAGQWANVWAELARIKDDLMKGMMQKIIDTFSATVVGCVTDQVATAVKTLVAHFLTGGLDFVALGFKAVANIGLVGGFIIKDWFTHNRQHATITLDYIPAQPTAQNLPAPTIIQDLIPSQLSSGQEQHIVSWEPNLSRVAGYKMYVSGYRGSNLVDTILGSTTSYTFTEMNPTGSKRMLGGFPVSEACIYVTAFNDVAESPPSANLCVEPGYSPQGSGPKSAGTTNEQVISAGNGIWTVAWEYSDSLAKGVFLNPQNDPAVFAVIVPATVTSWTDPTPGTGKACAKVAAYNDSGFSIHQPLVCNSVSQSPPQTVNASQGSGPKAPSNVQVTFAGWRPSTTYGFVHITWQNNATDQTGWS